MTGVKIHTTRMGRFEWEKALRDRRDITLPMRGVLMTLATYSTTQTGADIYPSIQRLSDTTGIARSTWNKHIKDAQQLGWLEKVKGGASQGRPSHYVLTVPDLAPSEQADTPVLSQGQGRPTERSPLSDVEDRTMSVINQGPPQEVPSTSNERKSVSGFAVVDLATIRARQREAQLRADMENAPPFD